MPINGVVFDLDNTLYAYAPCNRAGQVAVVKFLALHLGLPASQVRQAWEASRQTVHKRLAKQAASHARLFYAQGAIELLLGRTDIRLTLQADEVFWSAYLRTMRLRPGMRALLQQIKRWGWRLGIASDLTTVWQMKKLQRLGLAKMFDDIVTSEEAGCEKPNPRMIRLLLRKMQRRSHQVVLIGDSHARDRQVAVACGIPFLQLASNADVSAVRRALTAKQN
ncbi:MAG: HAD family hydrolase [Candidatus Kerfeldbacteria bacterium]|nr:HAD family hydrolase [Candidatus Kerfeldbacteria bacterium]